MANPEFFTDRVFTPTPTQLKTRKLKTHFQPRNCFTDRSFTLFHSSENLTTHEILEVKKYYLAKIFTVSYSWFMALQSNWTGHYHTVASTLSPPEHYHHTHKIQSRPYKKLNIKTFDGDVGRYCAGRMRIK